MNITNLVFYTKLAAERLAQFGLVVALLFAAGMTYAHFTKVHVLSQDIPRNLICVYNTGADVYLCDAHADETWYLDWKRPVNQLEN